MTPFYAIRTAPQREFAVRATLEMYGYRVVLPVESKSRRVNSLTKKRKWVDYPVFARYLFVAHPGPHMPWLHLMTVNHVTGVVSIAGNVPTPVSERDMLAVYAVGGRLNVAPNIHRALRVGDLAQISDGVFRGHIVRLEGLTGRKARIFLNLFGTRKEVEIGVESLEAA